MTPIAQDVLNRGLTAAFQRDLEALRRLFDEHPELVHMNHRSFGTWLDKVVHSDFLELAELVLDRGMDVDLCSASRKASALSAAAGSGRVELVELLIARGADVNHPDVPPLASAISNHDVPMIERLLRHGARIDFTFGRPPRSAVDQALRMNAFKIAAAMEAAGAVRAPRSPAPRAQAVIDALGDWFEDVSAIRDQWYTGVWLARLGMGRQVILVTACASDPEGLRAQGGDFDRAELVCQVPASWAPPDASFRGGDALWLANLLDELRTTLVDQPEMVAHRFTILEVAEHLRADRPFDSVLIARNPNDFGRHTLPDGQVLQLFDVFPLYPEERELEKRTDMRHLLTLFEERGISQVIDPHRENVGLPAT